MAGSPGTYSMVLGGTAVTDFGNSLGNNWFAVGFTKISGYDFRIVGGNSPTLTVTYESNVTFTNGANTALNYEQTSPSPPQDNWHFGQFSLAGDATGATLNSVAVMLEGTYDATDLGSNPFRLYASDTNVFGDALPIGSVDVADPGSGHDVTFSSLSDAIPSGTCYYWITADISGSATGDDNINGTIDVSGDLSITNGTLSGSSNYGKLNAGSDVSLPVVLSTFTVQYLNNTPTLYWSTQSETDNIGWYVYRNTNNDFSSSQKITDEMIPGYVTTTEPSYYIYNDTSEDIVIGQTYYYWLESIDLGGLTHYYDKAVNITIPDITEDPTYLETPIVYELQSTPNPAKFSTTISFTINKSTFAEVSIYNILGKLVRTLPMVVTTADEKSEVYWNGKDENGNAVKDGIYLYRLNVDGKPYKVKRLIVIR